jgi:imidazolonepropionase-like amidohydrolase
LSGLIWGNEIIWTDPNGNLICLITNDAEGDKLEMMETAHESLLPELISRGATYGMELFAASMKMDLTKNKTLAIIGGNIVDVESGQTLKNQTIIIENGLIKEMGAAAAIKIPANATIIHAEGKTILPGLWDMHSHFEQAEWGPAYLAAGVTTVRDCGNEFGYINAIKSAIDSHKGVGPNILKAGIVDGPGDNALGIVRTTTEEEAIRVVNMYKDNGFVQIKIYSSVKPPIVKAICTEAHRLGLTVTGHIPMGMTIQQGVEAGMDQVNHMQYVYSVMKKNKDRSLNMEDSASIAVLSFLKEHKTVIDPTIGVFELAFRNVRDDITIMEPNYYTLPLPTQVLFKNTGMPESQAKLYKPVYDAMKELVKTLYDKGITIVAGTDMGFPGYSVARELELYVEAGLTPLQAIQTATITPAQVMKMDQQTGSIRVGKQADLVIINGDPLSNIRDIRNVSVVIKQGQQYDPGTLHRMVGFSK